MSGQLLITHSMRCCVCGEWQRKTLFTKSQLAKKRDTRTCIACSANQKYMTGHNKTAHRMGVFECVVCGKSLTLKTGVDIIKDLERKHRKRSVCSDRCMDFYDSAIQYVNDLHGLKNVQLAREIVIAKWFERGVSQHEKHSRIQARNAQGNAAA